MATRGLDKLGLGLALAPVTAAWSAPFVVYLALLSNRIVWQRIKGKTYMGDRSSKAPSTSTPSPLSSDASTPTPHAPENDALFIATRSHANFLENVPLALTLAALAELNGAISRRVLHGALATLLALRIAHVELGLRSHFRGRRSAGLGRALGYYGTQVWLLAVAGWGAWGVRGVWGA
ncbi:membrane-associated, eicosanoid/glutathione metabolism protein [Phyllosticta citribraziliensis]|uniref:Membrane-associated, eicosanoid/glutathione metabolism protein n=1 Tax=Phyllosticta citribraziliensis TaxID=989973 RepID=A0ABR1L426_9PEZI